MRKTVLVELVASGLLLLGSALANAAKFETEHSLINGIDLVCSLPISACVHSSKIITANPLKGHKIQPCCLWQDSYNISMFIAYILLLLVVIPRAESAVASATFAPPTAYHTLAYVSVTPSTYVHVTLVNTPFYAPVLVVLRTTAAVPATDRGSWLHINPLLSTEFDYEGLVTGRQQYGWLANPAVGSLFYIYIINLEPTLAHAYTVTVTESNSWINSCAPSLLYPSTNYCLSCPATLEGIYCSITIHKLTVDQRTAITLAPHSYTSFTVPAEGDVTVIFSVTAGGVLVFLQSVETTNELAGEVNYFPSIVGEGRYTISQASERSIALSAEGQPVSIGVINTNAGTVSFDIRFTKVSQTNVMIIVIGVLGGLLLLGLIVAAFFVIRRMKNPDRVIHPEFFAPARPPPPPSNKLTPKQIDEFFPCVPCSIVYPSLQPSLTKITEQKEELKNEKSEECVICLCEIAPEEMIRAGYCKHIFHSNCLAQWFTKQQNCPYCRRDYSRKATEQSLAELCKESGSPLKGAEIVRGIFRGKLNLSMQTLQIEDIEDQNI